MSIRKIAIAWLLTLCFLAAMLPSTLAVMGAPAPAPRLLGDVNNDAVVDIDDILAVRNTMFGAGVVLTGENLQAALDLVPGSTEPDIDTILVIRGIMFGTYVPEPTAEPTASPTKDPNDPIFDLPTGMFFVRGNLMCDTCTVPRTFLWNQPRSNHALVFYATSGDGYVDDVVARLVEDYYLDGHDPKENVSYERAYAFLEKMGEYLKFYFPTPSAFGIQEPPSGDSSAVDYGSQKIEFYATASIDDKGRRVLTPLTTSTGAPKNFVKLEMQSKDNYNNLPVDLRRPDMPAVSNADNQDLVLKIDATQTLTFKYIPAGDFLRGSPFYIGVRYQDEYPAKATLTKPFYLAEIKVTQKMWMSVIGSYPVMFTARNRYKNDDYPIEFATLADIKLFMSRVSELNGVTVTLPTDVQWEYAARVGDSKPAFMEKYVPTRVGDGANNVWNKVAQRNANAWGLYDMLANCWEWTSSHKEDNLRMDVVDPEGELHTNPVKWKTKGGYHYLINAPHMHGAGYDAGDPEEGGSLTIRLCVDDADAVLALLNQD